MSVLLFAGNAVDVADNLLPTVAHASEGSLVLRQHEAGMDKAKARAVSDPGQGPGDDGVQRRAVADVALMPAFPGVDEALVRLHLQHLAADGAVPGAGRRRLHREVLALDGLEPGRRHDPA